MSADPALVGRIRAEIRERGPISFARFMELALYDSDEGYYSRAAPPLGKTGDFVTASDAGRAFGRAIARQLIEIDREVGPFSPFHVLEFGAGRGLLARDVIDAAGAEDRAFADRLRYVMVDRSPRMREVARRNAPEALSLAPGQLSGGHQGCVLAVELFDALPVHRVVQRGDEVWEIRVGLDDSDRLVEVCAPPTEELRAAAVGDAEVEVSLGAGAQLEEMAGALDRGLLLIVDYGERSRALGERRRGTLLAYHRHTTNEEYLERVGEQDLTAHVDFSRLERHAGEAGLDVLGLTTQDRFLVSNGILDVFEQGEGAAPRPSPTRLKERLQVLQLIHPEGMGRIFKVLLLSKNLRPAPALAGLRDPYAR